MLRLTHRTYFFNKVCYFLQIKNVSRESFKTYYCEGSNSYGSNVQSIILTEKSIPNKKVEFSIPVNLDYFAVNVKLHNFVLSLFVIFKFLLIFKFYMP